MASQREKRQMMDYTASHLEGSASPIISARGAPNFILAGSDGIVLLIDREFPRDGLRDIYRKARGLRQRVAAVLYKDGETFFRSAVGEEEITGIKSKRFKSDKGLSLKNYTDEGLRRMISFRPEERFLHSVQNGWLQYYQPASDKLEEGIETFRFAPVVYDYSHPNRGFVSGSAESEKLYLWDAGKRVHNPGFLALDEKFLQIRRAMTQH